MERLQKYIANSGHCSRRKAEELIAKGKVKVNNQVITEMGFKVDGNDQVEVEGKQLTQNQVKKYYLLYKPQGVITSVSDDKGRTTVVDLINENERIYPIGRLDYDTSGLLLLTNDGELANILMHPSYEVLKTYMAKIEGILTGDEMIRLKKGIVIDGRKVVPNRVKMRKKNTKGNTCTIEIGIVEGRNHIVKNIFKELGHDVIRLKRTSYAFLTLEGLGSGEYRTLSIKEVKKLYSLK